MANENQPSRRRLAVLMFTDLTDSVGMKRRLGADVFSRTLSRHDDIYKALIEATPGAMILKDLGDGFYSSFASAGDAVNLALLFQWLIHHEQWLAEEPRPRVGIHVGEVMELAPESDGRAKLIGLDADLTARVMGLSEGGQILMTRGVFDSARQTVREHPPVTPMTRPPIQWQAYGLYQFKGMEAPHEVFEVGAEGFAPLRAPADSEKARRASASPDPTLGWRPAAGLEIPNRPGWKLEGRIGEGGFGEVWLAINRDTGARRAFKFCFDADRLRSFQREVMLFKRLADSLGDRNDIARLYDTRFNESPYFIESEYSEQGNLLNWSVNVGGIGSLPMAARLDLFYRIAVALAAAHTADIVHKDLKPGNILLTLAEDGSARPKLADFGVGQVMSNDAAPALSASATAPSLIVGNMSSRTGSRLYAAPEIAAQQMPDKRSDVYSLGVLLYQLVIGRFDRPLATGWERNVPEARLKQLIAQCVDVDPTRRFPDAAAVAATAADLPREYNAARSNRAIVLIACLALIAAGAIWWWAMRTAPMNKLAATQAAKVDAPIAPIPQLPLVESTVVTPPVTRQAAQPPTAAKQPEPIAKKDSSDKSVPEKLSPEKIAPKTVTPETVTSETVTPEKIAPAPPVSLDQLVSNLRNDLPLGVQVRSEPATHSISVSGHVMNEQELTKVKNRLSRDDLRIKDDGVRVSPQAVARDVQQALLPIKSKVRENKRLDDSYYLNIELDGVTDEQANQVKQTAQKFVLDPDLVIIKRY